jgi:predicted Zn finger-like uncharacterized protein
MSSTTQCPACGTLFKVELQQLKTTKGWVRCGQCQEVFDAQSHMPEVRAVQKPTHGLNISFHADQHSTVPQSTVPQDSRALPEVKKDFSSPDWENTVKPPEPKAREKSDAKQHIPSERLRRDFTNSERIYERWANSGFPGESKPSRISEPAPIAPAPAPSFVVQAQRKQFWSTPWVRICLSAAGLVLLLGLGLQVLRHERDRIAAASPAALPWLQSLCSISACTVEPYKQIDAVVVEASSFNKLRGEGASEWYRLGVNLKNNGNLNVAMPHIELSLNDAQDRAVLRRVLSPSEFGSAQNVLAPITEFAGGTTLAVDTKQLAGVRVAGYRLWAFYP